MRPQIIWIVRATAFAAENSMKTFVILTTVVLVLSTAFTRDMCAQSTDGASLDAATFAGLRLRNIGPAVQSGRIADIVKDPTNTSTWYVAVASGNVWKTVNAGTTWEPVFETYGSFSTGSLAIDPSNPNVVWLGTGENASQRSAGFGDGIYKSLDGGKSWNNMGLAESEHIAKILIDPRNTDIVYAASQGPLWAPGGDRGLYKTTDGGLIWDLVLEISENTGVADLAFDPRDPDVIYAASYQRRRHVGVLVAGGPESNIYKTTDGGETWKQLKRGLPTADRGRIAIAVSPQQPDVVYALVAAEGDESGFFRSSDRGESWTRKSDYIVVDPQYYGEIYPDPHRFDRVYAVDMTFHVTHDGGRTFEPLRYRNVHVDHHALVFDPDDPDYLMLGNDGGIYESWDGGDKWKFVANLPITQFYRVGIGNESPFYTVCGGTQDNATLCGPSRTNNVHGIRNSDWFVTVGGDGFQPRIDPDDPNIIYSMYQYAGIVRYDRRSGERLDIQPQPEPGEPALRWHWDAPLIISPHKSSRLYFAANRLFRSEDRANTWEPISSDLSRGIDRNQREVMGRVWSVDAVWKNVFTSPYGTIVALDESPLAEGLLFVGTDDGLVQVTEDGGANWSATGQFPDVPDLTYVADVVASQHDPNIVFAVFNNHKEGDFTPYVMKSVDRGRSWMSIRGDLPDRQPAWTIVQDHVDPDLLFVGTEFALFFTLDGGSHWIELTGGVPTVAIRDLEIQRRENDLVCATFGRGFLIFDDYSPLRFVGDGALSDAALFPVKDALQYVEASPMGGSQGDAFFSAPNPPYGATFTYYLRDRLATLQQERRTEERRRVEAGERIRYPSWDELRQEDREVDPAIVLTVSDAEGNVVRRINGPVDSGFHRVAWDLRFPATTPSQPGRSASGPMVLPGRYTVSLAKRVNGTVTHLGGARAFEVVPLNNATLPAANRAAVLDFQRSLGELQRAVLGANAVLDETLSQLRVARQGLFDTPETNEALFEQVRSLEVRLFDAQMQLTGDRTISSREEFTPPSILDRVQRVVRAQFGSTAEVTTSHRRNYEIAAAEFGPWLENLRRLIEVELEDFRGRLEDAGVPWTRGQGLPRWRRME
jgi:photosystem II stability/assembly factor-like uncharacterized protein